jgi:molybdate transport system ATP-binding protein
MSLSARIAVGVGDFDLDVELNVHDGEVLAVLGPNGSGKSTLLRTIAGLTPIDRGSICVDGLVLDDPLAGTFVTPDRRPIGVVFQDYLLFGHLSALDNIAFGLRARGVGRSEARTAATHWLERVGLTELATLRPGQLSGGQAQRVALARALVTDPAVLLGLRDRWLNGARAGFA